MQPEVNKRHPARVTASAAVTANCHVSSHAAGILAPRFSPSAVEAVCHGKIGKIQENGGRYCPLNSPSESSLYLTVCWMFLWPEIVLQRPMVPLRTMTAPNGPPLLARIFSSERATARCI